MEGLEEIFVRKYWGPLSFVIMIVQYDLNVVLEQFHFFFFLNKYTDVGKIRKFDYVLYVVIWEKIVLFRGVVNGIREPTKANVPIAENTKFY